MGGREYLPWSQAMERALYGPTGFYRGAGTDAGPDLPGQSSGGQGVPAAHFRTSAHASPLFAAAVARLLRAVDAELGSPPELTFIDLGAGGGELAAGVEAELRADPIAERLSIVAVDLAPRPAGLSEAIEWRAEPPSGVSGLLIANEWLDNVPCDVAEYRAGDWRTVEVAADGSERLGPAPDPEQLAWLERWWPGAWRPGDRAEIGLARDRAWHGAAAALSRGIAVAVDYAHTRDARPAAGTLTGYARGRQVAPVPDGSRDITAHVALDACGEAVAARWTLHGTQRELLRRLGVSGARPSLALASTDPRAYIRALSQASAAAELTDPGGLGGFGWLVQGISVGRPREVADSAADAAP